MANLPVFPRPDQPASPGQPFPGYPPVPPARSGAGKKIAVAVVVLGVIVAIGGAVYWMITHPTVKIVNASTAGTISVFIDDRPVVKGVMAATSEGDARLNARSTSVALGPHRLVAKDGAGNVIDSRDVTIVSGHAYLYAPAHDANVCFGLQTDAYGSAQVTNPYIALDPKASFWALPRYPDYWFTDTPDQVKVKKDSSGTTKTALRQRACDEGDSEEADVEE